MKNASQESLLAKRGMMNAAQESAQAAAAAAHRAQSAAAAFYVGAVSEKDSETSQLKIDVKGWNSIQQVVNPASYDEGQPVIMLLIGGDRNMAMPLAFSPYQTGEIV